MLLPASIEFTNLCRTQVSLLMQSFEASLGAVYLSKDLPARQQGELIPVIIYPEDSAQDSQPIPLQLPASAFGPDLAFGPMASLPLATADDLPSGLENSELWQDQTFSDPNLALSSAQQVVIPLIHEEMVLGLLVVMREGHSWSDTEQSQLQRVADTLAIACILDQRSQWLANSQYQQRALQSEQQQTFSNLLHQFRNPLTALKTLGKLLQKRFHEDDNNRKIAVSIVEQSDRLEGMLHQFDGAIDLGDAVLESLDADPWATELPHAPPVLPPSPLPLGEDELQIQPCWFADILKPLLQSAIGRIEQKKLQLTANIPVDMPAILADDIALREICSNLLDNALKYTPIGGEVQVEVCYQWTDEDRPEQVLLISDSGPGIPPADLAHIFERQYRGIQAQTEIPGTGLGLAIAQVLVEQMHGEIRAFSPRIDQPQAMNQTAPGSTFMVKLPESEIKVIN